MNYVNWANEGRGHRIYRDALKSKYTYTCKHAIRTVQEEVQRSALY